MKISRRSPVHGHTRTDDREGVVAWRLLHEGRPIVTGLDAELPIWEEHADGRDVVVVNRVFPTAILVAPVTRIEAERQNIGCYVHLHVRSRGAAGCVPARIDGLDRRLGATPANGPGRAILGVARTLQSPRVRALAAASGWQLAVAGRAAPEPATRLPNGD
jgi:hypothetical protein